NRSVIYCLESSFIGRESSMEKTCANHPESLALATCKACEKSVCLMCVLDEKEGTFCSTKCVQVFREVSAWVDPNAAPVAAPAPRTSVTAAPKPAAPPPPPIRRASSRSRPSPVLRVVAVLAVLGAAGGAGYYLLNSVENPSTPNPANGGGLAAKTNPNKT